MSSARGAISASAASKLPSPDFRTPTATFLGQTGWNLLAFGLIVCVLGLAFGLIIYRQLERMPVQADCRAGRVGPTLTRAGASVALKVSARA